MSVAGRYRRNTLIGAFLAAAAFALTASESVATPADDPAIPVPHAVRLTGTPSSEVWETAPAISNFVEREPHEGASPSQRTEFRVAYDSTTMYVRVNAFDTEPEKIVGHLTRRDGPSPSDWIRVLIDSYHDR